MKLSDAAWEEGGQRPRAEEIRERRLAGEGARGVAGVATPLWLLSSLVPLYLGGGGMADEW